MKCFLTGLCLLMFTAAQGQYVFNKKIANGFTRHLLCEADSSFVITGSRTGSASETDLLLAGLDPAGDTLWTRAYGGLQDEMGSWVQKTSDGGYVVAGVTSSGGTGYQNDFYLARTDATGHVTWSGSYGGFTHDLCYFGTQTADGGFALAGVTESFGSGSQDYYLVKTDMNGIFMWGKTYGDTGHQELTQCIAASDGGFVMVGNNALLKIDTAGTLLWSGACDSIRFFSVAGTAGGQLVFAGILNSSDKQIALVCTTHDGTVVWAKRYPFSGSESCRSIGNTADGGFILTGSFQQYAMLMRLNGSGDVLWVRNYITGGSPGWGSEGRCARQSPDGGYIFNYIEGYLYAPLATSMLMKTDNLGFTSCPCTTLVINAIPFSPVIHPLPFTTGSGGGPTTFGVTTDTSGLTWDSETCMGTIGLEEVAKESLLQVFPNPFNETISLQTKAPGNYRLRLVDLQGKKLFETSFTGSLFTLDLRHIDTGIYLLQFYSGGNITVRKIVKH